MPITVSCGCGKTLRLADDKQGKRVRCPTCQGVLTVGGPAAAAGRAVTPAPSAARRAPADGTPGAPGADTAPAGKSKKWMWLLGGCLGLVVLGCGGTVGALALLIGLSGSSPESKLAGKWVLDRDATLQLNPSFAKTYEDVRFDFHKGGTVSWAWGGSGDVPGTWKKTAGDRKGLQLQLRSDTGRTITFPVVVVDDNHLQVEHPAKCQPRREGTPDGSDRPRPELAGLAKKVVGKWVHEEGRDRTTWEFRPDGTAKFTSTSQRGFDGKYRFVREDLLEVDQMAGTTVLTTARYQVALTPTELSLTNPVINKGLRYRRVTDDGPSAGAGTRPPPKAVVVQSARHNIVRSNSVRTLAVAPDGRTVAWTEWGANEMLRVWDVSGSSVLVRLKPTPPGGEVWEGLAFSPDGRTVAAGLSDGSVHLWDVRGGAEKAPFRGHAKLIGSLAFPRDRKVLVSGSWDKTIKVWDLATGKVAGGLTAKADVNLVSPSADGRKVAFMVVGDGVPHFGDLAAGKEVPTGLTRATAVGRCLALSPDGGTLALGTYDGAIRLLDTQTWRPKGELKGHKGTVTCLCFSGDGKALASGGEDKAARLWDVAGGFERATFLAHTDTVNAVGLSADGRVLASGGKDKLVHVWQAPGR